MTFYFWHNTGWFFILIMGRSGTGSTISIDASDAAYFFQAEIQVANSYLFPADLYDTIVA